MDDRDEDDGYKISCNLVPSHVPTVSYLPHPSCNVDTLVVKSGIPNKEELLIMIDKVDKDIKAVETQISALQKKHVSITNVNITKPPLLIQQSLYISLFTCLTMTFFLPLCR